MLLQVTHIEESPYYVREIYKLFFYIKKHHKDN